MAARKPPIRLNSLALRLLLLLMVATTSSCVVRSFDYEHLVLGGEMQAAAFGSPKGMDYLFVDEFPTRYQLRRQAYVLNAAVDPGANRPNVIFYVVGNGTGAFTVEGRSIRCGGRFRRLSDNDPIRTELPLAREQFTWYPTEGSACRGIDPEKVFHLSISSSSGQRYSEQIPFRVAQNGTHWVMDGP